METAIIIRTYNNATTIGDVIQAYRNELPLAKIYVYDNNSKDDTLLVASKQNVMGFNVEKHGVSNVMKEIFRNVEADCFIITEGNGEYPAHFATYFEKLIVNNKMNYVFGNRFYGKNTKYLKKHFYNRATNVIIKTINRLFKVKLCDVMSAAQAFSNNFVKTCHISSNKDEANFETLVFALENEFRVAEVPIDYAIESNGKDIKKKSKVYKKRLPYKGLFKFNFKKIGIYKNQKPLKLFGGLGLFFILISIISFIPIIIEYVNLGLVTQLPLFVLSILFFVVGVANYFCGIILNTIKYKNKQAVQRERTMVNYIQNITKKFF